MFHLQWQIQEGKGRTEGHNHIHNQFSPKLILNMSLLLLSMKLQPVRSWMYMLCRLEICIDKMHTNLRVYNQTCMGKYWPAVCGSTVLLVAADCTSSQ